MQDLHVDARLSSRSDNFTVSIDDNLYYHYGHFAEELRIMAQETREKSQVGEVTESQSGDVEPAVRREQAGPLATALMRRKISRRLARKAGGEAASAKQAVVQRAGRSASPVQDEAVEWSDRTKSLVGHWAKVRKAGTRMKGGGTLGPAYARDPNNKDKDGKWGFNYDDKIPEGKVVFVSGMVPSDGAVRIKIPKLSKDKTSVSYRDVWTDHQNVEPADEPGEITAIKEGAKAAKAADQTEKANTAKRKNAASSLHDLGEISELGGSFYSKAGAVLDTMVPVKGDSARLQINVNTAISPVIKIALGFQFLVERSDDGRVKARCEASAGLMASANFRDLVELFAQVSLFGYIEAEGDNGAEVVRLYALALYDRIAKIKVGFDIEILRLKKTVTIADGKDAADLIFGQGFLRETLKNMGPEDYVESGLGVEVAAGLGVGSEDFGAEASAAVRTSAGTRLTRGSGGGYTSTATRETAGRIEVEVEGKEGKWKVEGNVKCGTMGEEVEISAVRQADIEKLIKNGTFDPGAIKKTMQQWIGNVVSGVNALRQSGSRVTEVAIRKAPEMTFSGTLGSDVLKNKLAQRLKNLRGASFGQKLVIKAEKKGKEIELVVRLQKLSTIEYGDSPRDLVYVMVENCSDLIAASAKFPA